MKKKTVRIALDVLLTVMVVAEMFIQYTGNFLHEVIGFAFFATVAVHLLLSAKWMKSTARMASKGKLSGRRIALVVMASLLAVTVLVLGISSVAISDILASAGLTWTFGSYATWATVHALSAYAFCALVVVHLAMHWAFLASSFKVPYNPERRRAIGAGVHAVAAVGAVALGVTAMREAFPQAVAQTAASEATAGSAPEATSESAFASVSDQPHKGKGASAHSKSASASVAAPSDAAPSESYGDPYDAAPSESPVDSFYEAPAAPDISDSSDTADSGFGFSESESSASGICTLCRKQCPLSSPRCDKPYAAGLL